MINSFLENQAKEAKQIIIDLDRELSVQETSLIEKSQRLSVKSTQKSVFTAVIEILLLIGANAAIILLPIKGYMEATGLPAAQYTGILAAIPFAFFIIAGGLYEGKKVPFYQQINKNLREIGDMKSKLERYKNDLPKRISVLSERPVDEISINRNIPAIIEGIRTELSALHIETDQKLGTYIKCSYYAASYLTALTVSNILCAVVYQNTKMFPWLISFVLIGSVLVGPTAVNFFFLNRKSREIGTNSALWIVLGALAGFLTCSVVAFVIYFILSLIIALVQAIIQLVVSVVILAVAIGMVLGFGRDD